VKNPHTQRYGTHKSKRAAKTQTQLTPAAPPAAPNACRKQRTAPTTPTARKRPTSCPSFLSASTQHPPPPYAYLNNVSIPVFHHWPLSSICLVDPKHVEQVMVVSPPQPGHGMGLPSGPMDVRPMQKVHLVRPVPLQ